MKKILVIGSINQDLVVYAPHHPKIGETILGNNFQTFPGGKGANQAIAAARLGGNVQMIGCVGDDSFGKTLLQNLNKNNIDTSAIKVSSKATGVALITVDAAGQNTIVVVPGANSALQEKDLFGLRKVIQSADILVLQLEIPLEVVIKAIDIAYKNGVTIILNPAPAQKIPSETLKKVTYLIPNENEISSMTGVEINSDADLLQAAEQLFSEGIKQIILTMGEKGAYYLSPNQKFRIPVFQVIMIDSTAAGDAFIGGFAAGLANGLDIQHALLYASAAGALAVTRQGAQTSLPDKNEVAEFLSRRANEAASFFSP